jgi:hypothetical protein
VVRGYGDFGPLALATRAGLQAAGRPELGPARLSAAALSHETIIATTAAALERGGGRLLSEREVGAIERAEGEARLSATVGKNRVHRADMILTDASGSPREALEIELSVKGAVRLDGLLRAWRNAVLERKVSGVIYRCAPRVRPYLERAVERTKTEAVIAVRDL